MRRLVGALAILLPVLLGCYLLFVATQIRKQSTIEEAQQADVIIVLGAAEYRGRPSPVLQARLDHALALYQRGYAPYVLTTGGSGGDPVYTEGELGRAYLVKRGVPAEAILVEPSGATTAQSLDAAVEIMRRVNLHSCIVVSDGYHIYRVKRLLQDHNIQVYGSPRPGKTTVSPQQRSWLYLRQALGFALWQVGVNI